MVRVVRRDRQHLWGPRWWLGWVLVAILAAGCATTASFTADDTAAVDRLLGVIKERLDVAPEVARTKWNTKSPIDDPIRDKQIIDDVARAATDYGLDREVASAFFKAQIDASKAVQHALHAEWTAKRQPPFAKVADLGTDIRPMLDRLTPAMMRVLPEALPVLQRRGGRQLLEAQIGAVLSTTSGGDAAVREAVAPLLALSR